MIGNMSDMAKDKRHGTSLGVPGLIQRTSKEG